jgi:lipopolysaccharide/colanic/teichoic acid biosynthesis glycosyltransferase
LNAKRFTIFKFKTINSKGEISSFCRFLRKYKLDELPQLFNILKGEMSVVGPRPDIPGYYDKLAGNNRKLLKLKPGLTGYASINFFNEEYLLKTVENPKEYNDEIIFPKKVQLNLWYLENISFALDLKIIFKTLILPFQNK